MDVYNPTNFYYEHNFNNVGYDFCCRNDKLFEDLKIKTFRAYQSYLQGLCKVNNCFFLLINI